MNHLDRNYELQASLYQMIILILFNQNVPLSISDIVNQSGLSLADTMRSLKPLVDMRVLETLDAEPLLQTSDIKVNTSFTRYFFVIDIMFLKY